MTGVGVRSLVFYTRSSNPSGMGAHMLDLIEAFIPKAQVALLCRTGPRARWLATAAERLGAEVVPLPGPHHPAYPRVIADFLSSRVVDVFHGHAGWGWEDPWAYRIAREAGVPAVVLTHHLPFLIHNRGKAARLLACTGMVDARIAVSDALRDSYLRVGVPPDHFTVVPNGVRPRSSAATWVAARRELGLAPQDLVVMTTGRLTRMKGQCYLVEAAAMLRPEFPDLQVVILGDGDLRGTLQRQIAQLRVGDRVRLPGHRPDARTLLGAADVFALPSRSEGMPLALIEAMEAGLPVVATKVIGSSEVVTDGETGHLVPSENPSALASALRDLLADQERRVRYGAAGRRRYLEHFTLDRMVERTGAVYAAVLDDATADEVAS